jgi:hypothetical protein
MGETMNFIKSVVLGIFPLLLVAQTSFGQTSSAASILAQASSAFGSHAGLKSVTMTGQAQLVAGSTTEAGNITLTAGTDGSFQVTFSSGKGVRVDQQSGFSQGTVCGWTDEAGTSHTVPSHNCMVPVNWFLPMLSVSGGQQPAGILSRLPGVEGDNVIVRQSSPAPSTWSADQASLLEHLGTVDLHLNSATKLPTSLVYTIHPDHSASIDIPVRVTFSSYQVVEGVAIPFHIQRFVNGSLSLDITVTSASIN